MPYILFISKSCEFCNELIELIGQLGELKIEIDVVDITNLPKIPSFLDRVPLLFMEQDGKVFHDEELFEFIKQNQKSVEPFMIDEMKGLSDKYSFMEEKQLDHGYVFLDREEEIITKVDDKTTGTENKRILDYDKYLENRDSDINQIFKKQSLRA